MSNLIYFSSVCKRMRNCQKVSPKKGSKSQNRQSFNKYVHLETKYWPNLKTNWYKHFTIHFKHFIDVKSYLFSFRVCKRIQNLQKVSPKVVKITKLAIIQQICQF